MRRTTFTLAVATLVGLLAVNTVGFVDTETGSAFGCGHQWPLCDGAIIPSHWGMKTLIEFSHRGLVAVTTILLLALAIFAWRRYGDWLEARWLIILSVGFVFLQAMLGAVGVLFGDPAWFLAFHFGISLLAFNSAWLLLVVIRHMEKLARVSGKAGGALRPHPVRRSFRLVTWITLVYTYAAMYLGAFVASTGQGHLFRGWPIPQETVAQVGFAAIIDWAHRSVALGLVILLLVLVIMAWRDRGDHHDVFVGSLFALLFVVMQAFSGALLLATNFSLFSFLSHVTVVTFLFASECYLGLLCLPEPQHRTVRQLAVEASERPSKDPVLQ